MTILDWLIIYVIHTLLAVTYIFFVLKWIHSCWKISCFTWNLGFQRWIFTEKFSVLHSDHIINSLYSSAACFNNMGWLFSETNWSVFPWNVLLRINISPNSIYTCHFIPHISFVTQPWASVHLCARFCGGQSMLCCSSSHCQYWYGSELFQEK